MRISKPAAEMQAAFGRSVKAARQKCGADTNGPSREVQESARVDISRIEGGQINVTLRTMRQAWRRRLISKCRAMLES